MIDVKNLHPLEVKLLRYVEKSTKITADLIVEQLGYKIGQCNQAFSWLCAKDCLQETSRARLIAEQAKRYWIVFDIIYSLGTVIFTTSE